MFLLGLQIAYQGQQLAANRKLAQAAFRSDGAGERDAIFGVIQADDCGARLILQALEQAVDLSCDDQPAHYVIAFEHWRDCEEVACAITQIKQPSILVAQRILLAAEHARHKPERAEIVWLAA